MMTMTIRGRNRRRAYLGLGLLALTCGMAFYLLFRGLHSTLLGQLLWPAGFPFGPLLPPQGGWWESLPTFCHVVAFTALSLALFSRGDRRDHWIPAFWALVNILFELGQRPNWLGNGTFSWADISAVLIAGAIMSVSLLIAGPTPRTLVAVFRPSGRMLLLGAGVLTILGSGDPSQVGYTNYSQPLYMSYSELRQPRQSEAPRALAGGGKVYLYGEYLFVNAPNQGVHVVNNADPAHPVNQAFIDIPGNLDLAIKDGFLYADSYVDLVVIDLNDPGAIRESKRIENVFPYDPYQNLPENIRLADYDSTRGVVVGYREQGGWQ